MMVLDLQMRIWRANLELWQRAVEMQAALARSVLDAATAWAPPATEDVAEAAEASVAETEAAADALADAAVEAVPAEPEAQPKRKAPARATASGNAPARARKPAPRSRRKT